MKLLASKFDAYISSAKTYCLPISKYGLVSKCGTYAYCGCLIGQLLPHPTYSLLKPFMRQFVPGMDPVPLHAAKKAPELWSMSHVVSRPMGRSWILLP